MPTVSFTTSGALQKSALRHANERLVLDAIRRSPGISRAEIARITGFSRTSVTFVVNRLLKGRLVAEAKPDNGAQAGRPPTSLRLRAEAMMAVGIEIAKPESRAVLVDLNGEILQQRTVGWHANPDLLLDKIAVAALGVAASCKRQQVLGAGVSLPGTIDKTTGRVVAAEAIGWFGVEAGRLLRSRLEWPLFFENNANLCALAEQWYSPSAGDWLRYFVYLSLSGGLGSGVVVDGRILHGASSAGTEFGHVMLYPDGRPCNCGNRGCWEQYASDAALSRLYRELNGADESPAGIVREARRGGERALEALRTTARYLALGMVNLTAALNPQAIIVGEPMASAWDLVEDIVHAELRTRVPAYSRSGLRLLASRLGGDAALRGAASLALAHFFTRFDHTKDDMLPSGVAIEAHR